MGDGTPFAFVAHVLGHAGALPPVGGAFGAPILSQSGPTPQPSLDDPRPGDVVAASNAEFKGKEGLASYHATYPAFLGVVTEFEAKKNKVRALMQNPAGKKPIEEVSLRLDDLRAGSVRIWRPAPRQGWVDW